MLVQNEMKEAEILNAERIADEMAVKTLIVDDWVLVDREVVDVKINGDTIEIRTKKGIKEPYDHNRRF